MWIVNGDSFLFPKSFASRGLKPCRFDGTTVNGTLGKFYLEYRQDGKRIQRPCGVTPREALDAWKPRRER